MTTPLKCCVGGCDATSETYRLFSVPKDDELRKLWIDFIVPTNPLLIGLSKEQLLRKRLCHKHFERCQLDGQGRRTRYSYPSLFTAKEIAHGVPLTSKEYNVLSEHNYHQLPLDTNNDDSTDTPLVIVTIDDSEPLCEHSYASGSSAISLCYDETVTSYIPIQKHKGTLNTAEPSKRYMSSINAVVENTSCEQFTESSAATVCGNTNPDYLLAIEEANRLWDTAVTKPEVPKKVLQLRLIDDIEHDEPIYEVLTDEEGETPSAEQTMPQETNSTAMETDVDIEENLDISTINEPIHEQLKNVGNWKVKLVDILQKTEFCGICLNADDDLNATDDSFEVIDSERTHRQTLRRILDTVFKEPDYTLANSLICQSCTKKLIQSYIFIRNAEETSKMLNFHLDELYNKTCYIRNNVLADSNRTGSEIFNVVIAFDKGIPTNFTNYKMEPEEPKTEQTKPTTEQIKPAHPRVGRKLKCRTCNVLLPSYRAWSIHEAANHRNSSRCNICLQNFKTRQALTEHNRMHFKTRCKICHRLVQDGKLLQHLKRSHKHSIHLCSTCNIARYSAKALERHNKKCHYRGNSKCVTCLKSLTKIKLKLHQCRFKCPECREAPCVHHKYLMSYREQTLNLADRARCLDCSYVCTSKVALITHVNERHLNVQPYSCGKCKQKFYCRSKLSNHVCDATGIDKYVQICEYCDRRFSNKYMWQRHKKSCGRIQRQFQCEYCPANFDLSKDLTEHSKRRHGNNLFPCALCDRVFLNDMKKKLHVLQAHTKQTKSATTS